MESWLRGTDICVAFIDIDDFKKFNTKYTESIVDRDLLPRLMQTLEAHAYFHGWAYRFGGDEYLFILPNMPWDSALRFLQELQRKLGSLVLPEIHEPITISIGLCTVSADSILTEMQVQEKANKAKEFAKKAGKNRIASIRGPYYREGDLQVESIGFEHKEPNVKKLLGRYTDLRSRIKSTVFADDDGTPNPCWTSLLPA